MKNDDINEQMKKTLSEERESIAPKGDVKNRLDQAFEAKHKKTLWINYPVPAWQMAACIALLMVTGIAIGKFKPEEKTSSPLAIADTVYIEKVIPGKTDTVYLEKKSVAQQAKQITTPVESIEPSPIYHDTEMISPEMHISDFHNIQPNGSSVGEDSAAKSWMVRIM